MAGFEGLISPQTSEGSKTVDGKKTSSETATTPKSGPSLFDSMLAQVGGKVTTEGEVKKEGDATQTTQAKSTPTTPAGTSAPQDGETTTTAKSTTSNSSLFDKMVSQTNQEIKTQGQGTPTSDTKPQVAAQTTATTGETVAKDGTNVQNTSSDKNVATTAKSTYTVSPQVIEETTSDKPSATQAKEQATNTKVDTQTAPVVNNSLKTSKQTAQTGSETVESKTANKDAVKQTSTDTSISLNKKEGVVKDTQTNLKSQVDKTSTQTTNQNGQVDQNKTQIPTTQAVSKNTNTTKVNTQTNEKIALESETVKNKQVLGSAAATTSTVQTEQKENTNSLVKNKITNEVKNQTQNTNIKDETPVTTKTDNLKTTQTSPKSQNNNIVNNKTNTQETVTGSKNIKKDQTDKPIEQKSLADKLIASATLMAEATKPEEKGVNSQSSTKATKTISTPLNNTTITQDNKVLSSSSSISETSQGANTTELTTDSSKVVEKQSLDNKVDIKNIEQNIADRKVETKKLDTKNTQIDKQLDKTEQNKLEKLAVSSSSAAASSTLASSSSNNISNEQLASQLATIRESAKGEVAVLNNTGTKSELQNTSIKKDDLLNQGKKQTNTNSLLDKMTKEATDTSVETTTDDATLGTKDQFVQKDLPLFATVGYLHDQKRRNDIANMMKKSEGVNEALNAKGVSDIKKSAATLELNATEAEVVKEAVQKEETRVQNTREGMLKRLAFDNHLDKKLHNNNQQVKNSETIATKSTTLTNNSEEKVVEVAVSNEATQTIENRIMGARQTLRTMMSDVARQMAQNYKPPLTAFRINLNPSGLGNIAVMLKSDKANNGINISLNMSNASTHDVLVDNQAALRAALTRNFDNTNSFSLDFGMQQDSNNQSNQSQDGNLNQNSNSSNRVAQANNVNQESTEEVLEQQANYM